ncbi:MAG TPA: Nif3-like dinuclear metal center hexameric protein [Mycobacteriales bacterium]|nr:Nif3-like dinuclear metal center hexameric protein [Mycobacteriales bacterium]
MARDTALLRDIVAVLDALYDPAWAEPWDAVGLVCGDPAAEVSKVLFAVDPVGAVVEEAIASGAGLLVTHHPLFLEPVHTVAATDARGRLVHRLIESGLGLFVAHTNADVARPGVSDALAGALGLERTEPLRPLAEGSDKLVAFVPPADVDRVVDALTAAGAGGIGDYTRCAFWGPGTGTFRPGAAANPAIGRPGRVEKVEEVRVEIPVPRHLRNQVLAALRAAHPYEEPAFDVYEPARMSGAAGLGLGLGRVGELAVPEPLGDFVHRVARALPSTAGGVRATGDRATPVRRVAVCGGSGGELAGAAASAGADVLVTADLRHHMASDTVEDRGVGLVDVPHWASEWPWLADAAARVRAELPVGSTVDTAVSYRRTDPWTIHAGSDRPARADRRDEET